MTPASVLHKHFRDKFSLKNATHVLEFVNLRSRQECWLDQPSHARKGEVSLLLLERQGTKVTHPSDSICNRQPTDDLLIETITSMT